MRPPLGFPRMGNSMNILTENVVCLAFLVGGLFLIYRKHVGVGFILCIFALILTK